MRLLKALMVFALVSALAGSTSLFEAMPEAYAQTCPNGQC
jgi:hypothetical protein